MLLQTFRSWSGSLTFQRVLTMLLWPWVSTKTPRINHHTLQESIGVKGGNGKSCDECSMVVPSVNLKIYFGGFPNEQRTAWYLNIDENPETARAMAFPSHTSPKGHGPFWIAEQNLVLRCGGTAEKTYGFVEKLGIALHLRINHHFPIKRTAWEVYAIFRHTQINNSKHI
jgi:hypothetical protein